MPLEQSMTWRMNGSTCSALLAAIGRKGQPEEIAAVAAFLLRTMPAL
jgi:NAD(P)-dependent dehydrogenase (short-subunit alcohol dehydrogenase family)